MGELALRKQGAEPNGEAAQMHINKHVENMNQAASNMAFGVAEDTNATRRTFLRQAREKLPSMTEEQIGQMLDNDPDQLKALLAEAG